MRKFKSSVPYKINISVLTQSPNNAFQHRHNLIRYYISTISVCHPKCIERRVKSSLLKQLCLLTQTPPCMKVDCSVLRTPAIAAGIRKSPQSFHSCGFFAHTGLPVQCLCVSPCKHSETHKRWTGLSL